jgi:hypothetical protein
MQCSLCIFSIVCFAYIVKYTLQKYFQNGNRTSKPVLREGSINTAALSSIKAVNNTEIMICVYISPVTAVIGFSVPDLMLCVNDV